MSSILKDYVIVAQSVLSTGSDLWGFLRVGWRAMSHICTEGDRGGFGGTEKSQTLSTNVVERVTLGVVLLDIRPNFWPSLG